MKSDNASCVGWEYRNQSVVLMMALNKFCVNLLWLRFKWGENIYNIVKSLIIFKINLDLYIVNN